MRTSLFITAVTLASLTTTIGAQSRPDFSGTWTLVPGKSSEQDSKPVALRGEAFIAKQDANGLNIEYSFLAATRGGLMQARTVRLTYPFDGSESNVATIAYSTGSPSTRIVSKASWDGNRLVVVWIWRSTIVSETREMYWLDPDGTLVVEKTVDQDRPTQVTTRSVYKKAG
jgi:hypothetical protein